MIAGLIFIVGLLAVIAGAEILVASSSKLARRVGVSPLVIGLTVVAFGTSAPEMAISAVSALEHHVHTGLGNIIGSNIFNLMFILGIVALARPLTVKRRLLRIDVPVLVGISILVLIFALDGDIGFQNGLVLLGILAMWMTVTFSVARRDTLDLSHDDGSTSDLSTRLVGHRTLGQVAWLMVSLILLGLGSHWLVTGGTDIARAFGVSEFFIGLTMIAVGTSLPEVAASIAALRKKEHDMAVGNVIGSSIINILGVLPVLALLSPNGIPVVGDMLAFDLPVMLVASVICLPILLSGFRITRWEGAVMLAWYGMYLTLMVINTASGKIVISFEQGFLWFLLPVILVSIPGVTGFVRKGVR